MGPRIWQGGCLAGIKDVRAQKTGAKLALEEAKKVVKNKVDPGSLGVAMPQLFSTRRERESLVMG